MKYIIVRNCIFAPQFVPKEVMLERWESKDGLETCLGISYLSRHFTQNDIDCAIDRIDNKPERILPRG